MDSVVMIGIEIERGFVWEAGLMEREIAEIGSGIGRRRESATLVGNKVTSGKIAERSGMMGSPEKGMSICSRDGFIFIGPDDSFNKCDGVSSV